MATKKKPPEPAEMSETMREAMEAAAEVSFPLDAPTEPRDSIVELVLVAPLMGVDGLGGGAAKRLKPKQGAIETIEMYVLGGLPGFMLTARRGVRVFVPATSVLAAKVR